jgi:hypothetical protein
VVAYTGHRPSGAMCGIDVKPVSEYHCAMPKRRRTSFRGGSRWYDNSSRYLALIAAAIALVSTTVVFLRTGDRASDIKDLVAVCLGVLGLVAALQLEILFRTVERRDAESRHNVLMSALEVHPRLFETIVSATRSAVATLERTEVEEFREEVWRTFGAADLRLQELAQGRHRTLSGDNALLERFTQAQESLSGVTDDDDSRWWKQTNGQKFLELNKKLIGAGVTIERVWLLSRPPDAPTCAVIQEHAAAGIEVFVLDVRHIDLDRRLLVNTTLMDSSFVHEDVTNKQGRPVEYLFSENEVDLQRAIERFTRLKALAIRYSGPDDLRRLFARSGVAADDDKDNSGGTSFAASAPEPQLTEVPTPAITPREDGDQGANVMPIDGR